MVFSTTKIYNKNCKRVFHQGSLKYSILPLEAAGQILLSTAVHIMRIIDGKLVGIITVE